MSKIGLKLINRNSLNRIIEYKSFWLLTDGHLTVSSDEEHFELMSGSVKNRRRTFFDTIRKLKQRKHVSLSSSVLRGKQKLKISTKISLLILPNCYNKVAFISRKALSVRCKEIQRNVNDAILKFISVERCILHHVFTLNFGWKEAVLIGSSWKHTKI